MSGWDEARFSGEPAAGTRREREHRRESAATVDALNRLAAKYPDGRIHVDLTGMALANEVRTAEVVVLVRCRGCGEHLAQVRHLSGGRLAYGRPWREVDPGNPASARTRCTRCGRWRWSVVATLWSQREQASTGRKR